MKQVSTSDCWFWAGLVGNNDYGLLYLPGVKQPQSAHRFVYNALVGEVPLGLELDHLCRVKRCINPDHLEPVTHKENLRRQRGNKENHCLRGHELTEDNVYTWIGEWGKEKRQCKRCNNNRAKANYQARKVKEQS